MAFVKPEDQFKQYETPVEKPTPVEEFIVPIGSGITLGKGEFISPNYKKNSTGWKIDAQGNAEFRSITVPSILVSSAANVTVSGTTTETNISSGTVKGGTLGTSSVIKVRLMINQIRAQLAKTYTFRCYYGTTAVSVANAGNVASYEKGFLDFYLFANAATNSQQLTVMLNIGLDEDLSNASTTLVRQYNNGAASIDSTVDQTLKITVQFSAAVAGNDATFGGYISELVK